MELRNGRKLKIMREVNEELKRMSSVSISLRWESCESCIIFFFFDYIFIVFVLVNFDFLGFKLFY